MAEHPPLPKRRIASEELVLTNKQIETDEPNREREVAQTYCALGGSLPALNRDRFRPDVCDRPNRRSTVAPTDGATCSELLTYVGVLLLRLFHGVGKERHPPHGSKQATNPLPSTWVPYIGRAAEAMQAADPPGRPLSLQIGH